MVARTLLNKQSIKFTMQKSTLVTMYIVASKLIFITILLVIFIVFFGHPSYMKYRANKTIIIESKIKYKSENPPAITIAALQPSSYWSVGWKGNSSSVNLSGEIVQSVCDNSQHYNKTFNCI